MKPFTAIALPLALFVAAACTTMSPTPGAASSSIFGTVGLPGDSTPPPGSVLLISLVELATDSVLVQDRIVNMEEDPLAFTLNYDPKIVKDRSKYGISCALYVQGRLRYNNDPATARVITDGFKQSVKITLQRAH